METLYDSQKQSLKIAVAHHDGNNVRNYVCQKKPLSNQLWMEIFPWKSFCQTETWNMNMKKKLLLMRSSKIVNEKFSLKTLWGKSLSNWNMEKIAMAIMNGNTGNSFCKLKRNYCWINCKVKETSHEKEATIKETVNKHLIVETFSGKSLSNRNMEKTEKSNYWWIDCQNQSLKIAVAHHDRNNVPTIIFVNVKKTTIKLMVNENISMKICLSNWNK